jgi:cytochrome P450
MSADSALPHPTERRHPFDPPVELTDRQDSAPLSRMRYADGHVGWLVTSHALAREMLTDPRFSARSEFKRAPVHRPGVEPFFGVPAKPGWLVDMDPPEHTRLRRVLAGHFTARRMKELRPQIDRMVAELLDDMERSGPPADFVTAFAGPLPSQVICALLGVPDGDRTEFQSNSRTLFSLETTATEAAAAMDRIYAHLRAVAERPADGEPAGVIGRLAAEKTLGIDEIVGVGALLLSAGHDSTKGALGLSVFALLTHAEQRAALVRGPSAVDNAVEELMRYATIFHFGVPRTPLEDLTFAGQQMKAGDSVTISLSAANRDPDRFPDRPDALDLDRRTTGHLGFGYGIHQCLGQNLVRMELRAALPALFARFPHLELAVAPKDVPLATDMSVYGVHQLRVTW